jgi:hypothetical protein
LIRVWAITVPRTAQSVAPRRRRDGRPGMPSPAHQSGRGTSADTSSRSSWRAPRRALGASHPAARRGASPARRRRAGPSRARSARYRDRLRRSPTAWRAAMALGSPGMATRESAGVGALARSRSGSRAAPRMTRQNAAIRAASWGGVWPIASWKTKDPAQQRDDVCPWLAPLIATLRSG